VCPPLTRTKRNHNLGKLCLQKVRAFLSRLQLLVYEATYNMYKLLSHTIFVSSICRLHCHAYRLPAQSCKMKVLFFALVLLSIPCSAELCRRTGEKQCEPHSGKCLDAVKSGIEGTASRVVITRLFKYGKYCGGASKSCAGANNANAAGVGLVSPEPCFDQDGSPNMYDVACKVREHKWNDPSSHWNDDTDPIALLGTTISRPTMSVSMKLEMLPDPNQFAF
jgi:hypothetical protein